MIKVGILGTGVVGGAVVKTLLDNEEIITARAGKKIIPVKGVSKDTKIP